MPFHVCGGTFRLSTHLFAPLRSADNPCPTPAEAAQATALQLLEQGVFGRALAASTAAGKLPGGAQLEAQLATLRLICRLHLAGTTATCWQV